ncbi:MAG: ABC transporter permease subunit [Lachnospiraceae bacterium]|nr:ABC transporter permease subunit [Lachnospiraceae bacterium]
MTLLKHEIKMNLKSLLIWAVCVGFSCFGCLLLYKGLQDTVKQMADMYSGLGAFSAALGFDKISLATPEGYYATEIALIFAIGGAMFSAMTGAVMLSKEEEGHTVEFLNTLPFGRGYIVFRKYLALVVLILLFNTICILWVFAGFAGMGEMPPAKEFFIYHVAQLLMQLEVGSICFLLSAVCRRKQIGAALGFSILLYMMDVMCRIVPDIEGMKYITPYYFTNAADIFVSGSMDGLMAGISCGIIIASAVLTVFIYKKRNL